MTAHCYRCLPRIMALDTSVLHDKLAGNFDYDGYKAAER
jgi:hypothetical protein